MKKDLVSIKEASEWAEKYLGKKVSQSNIQYLLQYSKIQKYKENNKTKVDLNELKNYYDKNKKEKREEWEKKLGYSVNWNLSFESMKESETTKHVHRIHPYKGKFIPQLVEYFLDSHINSFKKEIYFKEGDTVIDPFVGSGTTLVQAKELGINSIGIDISPFNCLISKIKIQDYDVEDLEEELKNALRKTEVFSENNFDDSHDNELNRRLSEFNKRNFHEIDFKKKVYDKEVNEEKYGNEMLDKFLKENKNFIKEGEKKKDALLFSEEEMPGFLRMWFNERIRQELFYYIRIIETSTKDDNIRDVMKVILSRTARSCRATTHSDLATLKKPQRWPYYCHKHFKICRPVNSIIKHLKKNTLDTLKRIKEFSKIKREAYSEVINSDSRETDVFKEILNKNADFYKLLKKNKIDGIFTSPPYVGQIDYHQQHAYAYELFGIERRDEEEIGPLWNGKGKKAKESYVEGISQVLKNMNNFLSKDANIFIVANDKFDLYSSIAEKSNLKIVNTFERPVLNRTERDKQPYSETIFHMKKL